MQKKIIWAVDTLKTAYFIHTYDGSIPHCLQRKGLLSTICTKKGGSQNVRKRLSAGIS